MSALLWWLIPVGATLLALAWAALRSRPRRPADTHASLGDMARFRAAMRRPLPDSDEVPPASQARPQRPVRRTRPPRPSASAVRARRASGHGRGGRPA
ncbi:MAG: hypothetical protein ACR2KE_03470 [Candidatus Nanopelagicales bacterium]